MKILNRKPTLGWRSIAIAGVAAIASLFILAP